MPPFEQIFSYMLTGHEQEAIELMPQCREVDLTRVVFTVGRCPKDRDGNRDQGASGGNAYTLKAYAQMMRMNALAGALP